MEIGRRQFLGLAGLLMGPPPAFGEPQREQAHSAAAFLDSIGVCTHWTYPDTPYGYAYPQVRKLLLELGVRHIRDGFSDRIAELGQAGVKTCLVVGPEASQKPDAEKVADIVKRIKAFQDQGAQIDAVEGPNEPDLFWPRFHISYKGHGGDAGIQSIVQGVIAFMSDLYPVLKADKALAALKVIGPALGITYDPGAGHPNPFPKNSLAPFVDWGNFHPYCGGNPFSVPFPYNTIQKYYWQGDFPSSKLDEFPYAFNTYAPPFAPKPMAATETGYSTNLSGPSEAVHAKYMPRLFCENFRLGIRRSYSYELVDEFKDPDGTNGEAHFGLIRRDLTPKPAYYALKNLIALLKEERLNPHFLPQSVPLGLQVAPIKGYREPNSGQVVDYNRTQYVHHLLLQKSTGELLLLLWHEVSNEDTSLTPPRVIQPPAMPATITLPPSFSRALLYRPNQGLHATSLMLHKGVLEIEVPDEVVVLRFPTP